jgi:hypothetical protein
MGSPCPEPLGVDHRDVELSIPVQPPQQARGAPPRELPAHDDHLGLTRRVVAALPSHRHLGRSGRSGCARRSGSSTTSHGVFLGNTAPKPVGLCADRPAAICVTWISAFLIPLQGQPIACTPQDASPLERVTVAEARLPHIQFPLVRLRYSRSQPAPTRQRARETKRPKAFHIHKSATKKEMASAVAVGGGVGVHPGVDAPLLRRGAQASAVTGGARGGGSPSGGRPASSPHQRAAAPPGRRVSPASQSWRRAAAPSNSYESQAGADTH